MKKLLLVLSLVLVSLTGFAQTTAPDATKPYLIFDASYNLAPIGAGWSIGAGVLLGGPNTGPLVIPLNSDGGMQNYSDIIKALALGADYVMVGSIFNKCIESAGSNYIFKRIPVTQCVAEYLYGRGMKIHKKFRGMSTKEVQKSLGNDKLKTSEGVIRYRPVEYTINGWVENFEAYLRSAMSYTNAKTLKDFIGETEIIQISDNAYKRIKK